METKSKKDSESKTGEHATQVPPQSTGMLIFPQIPMWLIVIVVLAILMGLIFFFSKSKNKETMGSFLPDYGKIDASQILSMGSR